MQQSRQIILSSVESLSHWNVLGTYPTPKVNLTLFRYQESIRTLLMCIRGFPFRKIIAAKILLATYPAIHSNNRAQERQAIQRTKLSHENMEMHLKKIR